VKQCCSSPPDVELAAVEAELGKWAEPERQAVTGSLEAGPVMKTWTDQDDVLRWTAVVEELVHNYHSAGLMIRHYPVTQYQHCSALLPITARHANNPEKLATIKPRPQHKLSEAPPHTKDVKQLLSICLSPEARIFFYTRMSFSQN